MKQNSQWLSQVRTASKIADSISAPSGSPAAFSTSRVRSRPPRATSISRSGVIDEDLVGDHVAGYLPVERAQLVPWAQPGAVSTDSGHNNTTRGGRHRPRIRTGVLGYPPERWPWTVCCCVRRGGSAPAWRWPSRPWRGWFDDLDPPVYCYHEIVHNQRVVDRFRDLGVVFVDDLDEVPAGSPIMLSAHGSAPEVVEAAVTAAAGSWTPSAPGDQGAPRGPGPRRQGLSDRLRRPRGPRRGRRHHGRGPRGHRPGRAADVAALPDRGQPVALLAQTTLSHRDWASVLEAANERWPELWQPGRSDLCFATTNRQSGLLKIADRCDAIVVIGSARTASNTRALEQLARDAGVAGVFRVNDPDELPGGHRRHGRRHRRGLHARGPGRGRRRPPPVALEGTEEVWYTDEDEYFPPPRNPPRDARGGGRGGDGDPRRHAGRPAQGDDQQHRLRRGHPRRPGLSPGRATLARYWTWMSVKPARPQGPFSTPSPLHLKPPKGWWGARARWALTQAVPHSSRSATPAARSASADHTEPERPKRSWRWPG